MNPENLNVGVAARAGQTPLWASYGFSFVNSLGTFIVTGSALFFLTRQGFGFTETQNFLLAVLLGVMYIAGAMLASRVLGALRLVRPGMSHRALLIVLMVFMAGLCVVPWAAQRLAPPAPGAAPSSWPVWVIVLLYSPLTGVLWPLVESYVSGGRSGQDLRSTMGWWNVVWCSAGIVATLAIAPLVAEHPALALVAVGGAHLAAAWFLRGFGPDPAAHIEGEHEPHPPVYAPLLVTFRVLVPMAYAVSSALAPYLPEAAATFKIPPNLQVLLTTAWILPRVVMFAVMQVWQGWHGRWYVPVAGGVGLVAGFAAAIVSTSLGPAGIWVMLAGLAVFGAAMAVIYTGAIYYAMEVGKAEVDAGGVHEALIGVGYTVGPAIGLAASLAVDAGVLAPAQRNPVMLKAVLAGSLVTAGVVLYLVNTQRRRQNSEPQPTGERG